MGQRSQLASLGLFDAKVPRYTSYPTVANLNSGVKAPVFEAWLTTLAPGSEISLYLHVPFCRRLCWFCAYRTQSTQSDATVRAYVDTLKAELALVKSRLPEGVLLSSVYWGGGTPTLLSAQMISEVAKAQFDLAPLKPGGQFCVEVDPTECDVERIDALVAMGMNRASIGIQDFDIEVQTAIGRQQSFETTNQTFEMLRARGLGSIHADFLYGLPYQTPERMSATVQNILAMSPDRAAIYGYSHVPYMARRQTMIPSEALPTPEASLDLFEAARRLFLWDGYRAIGIDHVARPESALVAAQKKGQLRRSFQGYIADTAEVLIGIGASAISRFPQGYAQNATGTADHSKAIAAGQFSTTRGHVFRGDDRLRGRLIESLMCDFRISMDDILSSFSVSAPQLWVMLEKTARAFPGMVELTQDGLHILDPAKPLTRMIARSLDIHDQSKANHSSAV